MVDRRRHTPGRWLAPVALITCIVAVYAVVDNTLLKDGSVSNGSGSSQQSPSTKPTSGKASKARKHRRSYTVKSGDTLSAISIRTGVSLVTIQRLNPKLDAQTLHAGERVRLSR
jgi:LysM repeat protein